MIRTAGPPKNARSKRALKNKESKIVENVKLALFIPGKNSNKILHDAMVDLSALKKPYMIRFQKKNNIRPFEEESQLEFFSEKNDSSLLVFSSSNKKKPNNLTFIRTFNYKIYDMIELRIKNNFKFLMDFKKQTFQIGLKPLFIFNGPIFDIHPVYKHIKSLFLDFFKGEITELQDVAGLQHIIAISANDQDDSASALPDVYFRVYKLKTFRSDQKLSRVELDEIGPRFDFTIGRYRHPSPELEKEAMRKPKQIEPKVKKNVETDLIGDKIGTIHVGKQDLSNLQTRKMKGLKKKYDQVDDDFDDQEIIPKNKKVKA
ncbi:rRNA-binding ribosome biosynthesis protein RPF2 [Ascoidea rubescens DSM 1968]|uniref:Ribosome production factor 2 homolog n=1 Tax=Ascoidea rubescens DSM 1968 TaxID=1344418 RepID=A0A1D2VIB0_9ASCO|nr:Brix-domain-containing protein [Ascoidea rubescens DSM 1968]ODV61359.1 Brix-domain-containing protein [Ascoidea rubescens DSM 1968]